MQAVILARFQNFQIDSKIHHLISNISKEYENVIVVLGESPLPGSKNNPFSFESRKSMLTKAYPQLKILAIKDHPNNQAWSQNLDNIIISNTSDNDVLIFGSKDHFTPYYKGKFKTREIENHFELDSAKITKQFNSLESRSEEFRKGISYAYHQAYDKVYPTVDIAVFRNDKKEILLGKKSLNNKWRFIGGFVDPSDESFEEAALRELKEEAGNIEVKELSSVCTQKVDDWRYRFEKDKIITTLFQCSYVSGDPEANDDISDLQWFKVKNLPEMIAENKITPEHNTLFNTLLKKIN